MTDATVTPDTLVEGVVAYGANGEKVVGTMRGMDEYGLEEQRIGTWIDGRPLYRKVAQGITKNTDGDEVVCILKDADSCTHIYGTILRGGVYDIPLDSTDDWNSTTPVFTVLTWFNRNKKNVGLRHYGTYLRNANYTAIVEYVKTTDQPDSIKVQQIEDMKISSTNVLINVDTETKATTALSKI